MGGRKPSCENQLDPSSCFVEYHYCINRNKRKFRNGIKQSVTVCKEIQKIYNDICVNGSLQFSAGRYHPDNNHTAA